LLAKATGTTKSVATALLSVSTFKVQSKRIHRLHVLVDVAQKEGSYDPLEEARRVGVMALVMAARANRHQSAHTGAIHGGQDVADADPMHRNRRAARPRAKR
jgi:hypothetical protein